MAVTAGATFTFIPTWVEPLEPVFNTVITSAESMKKEYFSMGVTSIDRYKLTFSGVSDTSFNGGTGIHDHYKGQYGGYAAFIFSSIPSYISASSVTGRWVEGSFSARPNANDWDIELLFEKDPYLN